jgi:hypothetical protein
MLNLEPTAATISIDNGELPLLLAFKHVPNYHRLFTKMLEVDPSVATVMLRKNKVLLEESQINNHELLPKIRRTKSIASSPSSRQSPSSSASSSSPSSSSHFASRGLSRTMSTSNIASSHHSMDDYDEEDDDDNRSQRSGSSSGSSSVKRNGKKKKNQNTPLVAKKRGSGGGGGRGRSKFSSGAAKSSSRRLRRSGSSNSSKGLNEDEEIDNDHFGNDDDDDAGDNDDDEGSKVEVDELFVTSALHEALRYGIGLDSCRFILQLLGKTPHSFLLKRDVKGHLPLHLALGNGKLGHDVSTASTLSSSGGSGSKSPYESLLFELIMLSPSTCLQLDANGSAPYHIALLKRSPPPIIELLVWKNFCFFIFHIHNSFISFFNN